jgi:hypothetical protein
MSSIIERYDSMRVLLALIIGVYPLSVEIFADLGRPLNRVRASKLLMLLLYHRQ